MLDQVRRLSKEILLELFNEERITSDSSSQPEQLPVSTLSSTGMGSSNTSSGKYEGFGNSPIDRATVTDRFRDMLESVMNLPDPKQEIMKLCLEDNVGDYKPLVLDSRPVSRQRTVSSSASAPKPHTPGRAGGGWSSSSEDEEAALEDYRTSITEEVDKEEEYLAVLQFCNEEVEDMRDIHLSLEKCLSEITGAQANVQTGLFCIINILEEQTEEQRLFRALLLLEHLVHKSVLPQTKILNLYSKVQEKLVQSDSKRVATKAKKISLILAALTTSKN